jgi:hypothetical protein
MSVSSKVMLFTVVAIGATAIMGGAHYRLASQGRQELRQLLAAQEQEQLYASLKNDARDLAEVLLLASQGDGAPRVRLAEHEQHSHEDFERIRELWAIAQEPSSSTAHAAQRELFYQLKYEHQQWLTAFKALSEAEAGPREAQARELRERFTRKVDPLLQKLWAAQRDKAEELKLSRMRACSPSGWPPSARSQRASATRSTTRSPSSSAT